MRFEAEEKNSFITLPWQERSHADVFALSPTQAAGGEGARQGLFMAKRPAMGCVAQLYPAG